MTHPLPVLQPGVLADGRKPAWLKVRAPGGPSYMRLRRLMRSLNLHSVCEEAHCPNIGECWEDATATFMILGDVCTRNCGYCAVAHGTPVCNWTATARLWTSVRCADASSRARRCLDKPV